MQPLVKIAKEKEILKIFLKFAYSHVRRGKLALIMLINRRITVIMAVSLLLEAVNGKN